MTIKKTITIAGDSNHPLTVKRLGYGTMRLTGEGFYGEPKDRNGAIALLKRAVELGVNFFDTADFYGPGVTNRLLAEALYPYHSKTVIATKIGAKRGTDKSWLPYGKPEELRLSVENNLKELKLDQLSLVHYGEMPASDSNYEEGLEALLKMQSEGKILHIGLTNATLAQFNTAHNMCKIRSVENMYSYSQRVADPTKEHGMPGGELLSLCEENGIPFIPYFSLQTTLPTEQDKMKELAEKKGVSVAQLNIAWLLHKSEWMLPIPGTTSIKHLEENIAAGNINLTAEDMNYLETTLVS